MVARGVRASVVRLSPWCMATAITVSCRFSSISHDHGLTPRSFLHERDGAPRVEGRVRDLHLRHSRREANKTMIVQVEEFLAVHLPINGRLGAPSTGISRRSLPLNLASLVPAGTGCVKEQCGRFS